VYCQNYRWSQQGLGEACDAAGLAAMLRRLREAGCVNWNLVSPTPWLPFIRDALALAVEDGPRLPVVYNTSGYERPATLAAFAGLADVFLVDLRYASEESAVAGSGAGGYVGIARAAVEAMWRRTGPLKLDATGAAVSGTVCRLLVLPGRADEAVANLEWLAAHVGTSIPVSVMAQYVPLYRAIGRRGWNRRISRTEYETVCEAVERLGFGEGWVQEFEEEPAKRFLGTEMRAGASC
jgi:putative pyruvate formate lyase activating enzyme